LKALKAVTSLPEALLPDVFRASRSDSGSGAIIEWFADVIGYINLVGEPMPHMSYTFEDGMRTAPIIFLPSGIYNNKMEVIRELRKLDIIPEGVSVYTVYHLWQKHIPHCQIRDWAPFSKCDICCVFKTGHIIAVTELKSNPDALRSEKYLEMKTEKDAHISDINLYRLRLSTRITIVEVFKRIFLFMYIDGMDNQKTSIPHLGAMLKNKAVDGAGMPLQTKLLGVLVPGRAFYGFITLPTMYHGANATWTALLHVLDNLKKEEPLPPVLLLQLDNCGKDNKNVLAFAFLALLVLIGVFEEVQMLFMPVGHTHNEIDQHFSVFSQKIRAVDLLTLMDLLRELGGIFQSDGSRIDIILEQVL
jgi:hypothetical protein